jgi:hypothetical protein
MQEYSDEAIALHVQIPIRTTVEDVRKTCNYLAKKPTGASLKEAKSVVGTKPLDGRKLNAYKFWRIIEDQEQLKLTELGRKIAKDGGILSLERHKASYQNDRALLCDY